MPYKDNEDEKAAKRKYYHRDKNNPEFKQKQSERKKRWYRENKATALEQARRSRFKCEFGLVLEDYYKMLDEQGKVCAICGGTQEPRYLAIDHCHVSGNIRGLLCGKCNIALERLDNVHGWAIKAQQYLDKTLDRRYVGE